MANMAILGWSGLKPKIWVKCLKTCVDMVREVGNGFLWHIVKKHCFGPKSVFVTKSEENGIFRCVRRPFHKENREFPKPPFGQVQREIRQMYKMLTGGHRGNSEGRPLRRRPRQVLASFSEEGSENGAKRYAMRECPTLFDTA